MFLEGRKHDYFLWDWRSSGYIKIIQTIIKLYIFFHLTCQDQLNRRVQTSLTSMFSGHMFFGSNGLWKGTIWMSFLINRLQSERLCFYLRCSLLHWHRICCVALMLIYSAQRANKLLVCLTVDLHQLVVLCTHLFFQWNCSWDQLVLLQHRNIVVRLEVSWTVRRQTRQASHRGFVGFGPTAEITGDISRAGTGHSSRGRSLMAACLLQLLHNLGEIGILR